MKRSYKQNCGLAHALDLIGERWTLLIVRELLIGPRRYGELLNNLIGIGTNLLANRLKEMEASGLVSKVEGQYRLTDVGRRLEPLIWQVVRFGLSLGIEDSSDRLTRPEWDAVALRALYDADRDTGLAGRYVVRLNDVPFCIDKRRSTVSVTAGRADDDCPDCAAAISLSKPVARQLANRSLSVAAAEESGKLTIDGSRREAKRLLRAFGLGG